MAFALTEMKQATAKRWAWWMPIADLRAIYRKAGNRLATKWSLGRMVKLTTDEWEKYELWYIRNERVFESVWLARRRRKRQERYQRQREKRMRGLHPTNAPTRWAALVRAIGTNWMPALKLKAKLERSRAFCRPDGKPLTSKSFLVTLHQQLAELVDKGLIESEIRTGKFGQRKRFVRRRRAIKNLRPRSPRKNAKTAVKAIKRANPDKMGVSSHKDASSTELRHTPHNMAAAAPRAAPPIMTVDSAPPALSTTPAADAAMRCTDAATPAAGACGEAVKGAADDGTTLTAVPTTTAAVEAPHEKQTPSSEVPPSQPCSTVSQDDQTTDDATAYPDHWVVMKVPLTDAGFMTKGGYKLGRRDIEWLRRNRDEA